MKYVRRWWHLITHRDHSAVTIFHRGEVIRIACDCGRTFVLLLALALPAHAERRISLVIPQTRLHVGESAKLPVGIPSPILIQMQTLDLTILYPQNIRITAAESVLPPGCTALVNTSVANTAHLSAMCANAQWLSGPLEWLTVQGMAVGKASLIMDCAFSQLRGTLADGYPAEIRLDCDGVAGVEVVP